MGLVNNKRLGFGLFYFAVLLSIGLWVRDIPGQPDTFAVTLHQLIMGSFAMGDPSSFATAAVDIAETGWVRGQNRWIVNLWPPGFLILEASIVKLFGLSVKVVLALQILSAALFSVLLLLLGDFFRQTLKGKFDRIIPLAIFAFPVSRVFLLQPTGVTLGEGFAIGFFLIGVLMLLRAVDQGGYRFSVGAGLCLALAAYFRSQFEIILLALTGWGLVFVIGFKLKKLKGQVEQECRQAVASAITAVLLIAHAATMPWRAYHWIVDGKPFWVSTSSAMARNSVMTTDQLAVINGGFIHAGGGNLVCTIDPSTCGNIPQAKMLFVRTFLTHPFEWYSVKLGLIGSYWFSPLENWVEATNFPPVAEDLVINGLILIALVTLLVLLFTARVRSYRGWGLLFWVNLSLYSSYPLIFTLAHFEVRYFYFPKVACIFMTLVVLAVYCHPLKK